MSEADDRIRLARDGSWIIWEDPQLSELMDDLFAAVDERDALRTRVEELEQKLQDSATEARYLNDWRKWQERNR